VVSGISSLFRPSPSPTSADEDTQAAQLQNLSPEPSIYSEVSTPSAGGAPDPFFDPPFFNDVAFINRGWVKNVINFATKHKEENLVYAAANHIFSHLEFGACLADYPELRSRYSRLRRLEDVDDWRQPGEVRVRFVNYYTVSTGIPKKSRLASPNGSLRHLEVPEQSNRSSPQLDSPDLPPKKSTESSRVPTPRISIEEYSDTQRLERLQILDPIPEPEPSDPPVPSTDSSPGPEPTPLDDGAASDNTPNQDPNLPPIPSVPSPPTPPDLDSFPDKESRKHAEKAFKAKLKAYNQALKAHDKAIKARQKALDKQHREALKLEKKQARLHKSPPPNPPGRYEHRAAEAEETTQYQQNKKPPRRRKFCMLPPKSSNNNSTSSSRDPTWVEVYMEGVDEVGAHCGLFVPGPHYERLVGDVGERIAGWVWEDASRRAVRATMGMEGTGEGEGVGEGVGGGK
jgi:hypothetical protein